MTSRVPVLFILIITLLAVGLSYQRGAVAALALPLIVYLGAALLHKPPREGLLFKRQIGAEKMAADSPVTVKLTVTNGGPTVEELTIIEQLPQGFKLVEGSTKVMSDLETNASLELSYTIKAARGEYQVYATEATRREGMNLFYRREYFSVASYLSSRPRFPKVKPIPVRPPQTRGFSGPIPARIGGAGVNFLVVRDYQPGDPQRQINWRLSARSENELFSNVFEQERVADVGLILDARWQNNIVTPRGALFEHAVRATASLAESFLRDGNRVSLLVYGSGGYVFPGYGKVQLERITRALARAAPSFNYALEHLGYLPTRLFPSGSQVVMVSPMLLDDLEVLMQMRSSGYAVLVVSPDALDFELPGGAPDGAAEGLAYRLARIERAFLKQRIRHTGVQVVDWQVNQPLDNVIRVAAARQRMSHRLALRGGVL